MYFYLEKIKTKPVHYVIGQSSDAKFEKPYLKLKLLIKNLFKYI